MRDDVGLLAAECRIAEDILQDAGGAGEDGSTGVDDHQRIITSAERRPAGYMASQFVATIGRNGLAQLAVLAAAPVVAGWRACRPVGQFLAADAQRTPAMAARRASGISCTAFGAMRKAGPAGQLALGAVDGVLHGRVDLFLNGAFMRPARGHGDLPACRARAEYCSLGAWYRRRKLLFSVLLPAALLLAGAAWAERELRVYRSFEEHADHTELPPDWNKPAGFVIAPADVSLGLRRLRGFRGRGGDWRQGGTSWAVDYPKGDRYYASILRRLTTIDVRSVEQPVNLEDGDDVFDWPYLIVGLAGYLGSDDERSSSCANTCCAAASCSADSFFGSGQWEGFAEGMRRVFPDREIIDLPDDHPLFHTVYNLEHQGQVPNMNSLLGGGGGYLSDGDDAALARDPR